MERQINKKFWKNKRVFVTGHTGFKGSWLTIWLKLLGAEVTGFSLPALGTPNLYDAANVAKGIKSIIGDIRDYESLKKAMQDSKAEIVLHLAAQPLVRVSYDSPRETYETNVMGTVNLLESVRQIPTVKSVVVVTTDKCYENKEWIHPYRENDQLGGHDPYSNSKACAELISDAYRRSFLASQGVGIATARAGNVIGGGDWSKDRLIPDVVRSVFASEKLVVRNPEAVRPWQHVLDPLHGYLLLAESLYTRGEQFSSAWNFAPSESAKPVKEILELFSKSVGKKINWSKEKLAQPHEAATLQLDATKAKQLLQWNSFFTVDQAIAETADWYKSFYGKEPIEQVTNQQILSFMEGVK